MYIPNFIEIGQTFCARTYGRTYVPTDGRTFPLLMLLGRLGGDDLIKEAHLTLRYDTMTLTFTPTQDKAGHFGDVLPSQSLGLVLKK